MHAGWSYYQLELLSFVGSYKYAFKKVNDVIIITSYLSFFQTMYAICLKPLK